MRRACCSASRSTSSGVTLPMSPSAIFRSLETSSHIDAFLLGASEACLSASSPATAHRERERLLFLRTSSSSSSAAPSANLSSRARSPHIVGRPPGEPPPVGRTASSSSVASLEAPLREGGKANDLPLSAGIEDAAPEGGSGKSSPEGGNGKSLPASTSSSLPDRSVSGALPKRIFLRRRYVA